MNDCTFSKLQYKTGMFMKLRFFVDFWKSHGDHGGISKRLGWTTTFLVTVVQFVVK